MKYIPNLLPYSGAKLSLLKDIFELIPKDEDIIINDVFGGSACLSINAQFKFPRAKVRYNELDKNVFGIIESLANTQPIDQYNFFKNQIEEFNLNDRNSKEYYQYRDYANYDKNPLHDIVLTRHAYSSTPRWSSKGFNNPFGERTWNVNSFWKIVISRTFNCLKHISLDNLSYEDFIKKYKEIDKGKKVIFYFDPPYEVTNANYNHGWNKESEKTLLAIIDKIVSDGNYFILSNVTEHQGRKNDLLIVWMLKYNVRHLDKHYALSRSSKENNKTDEVLVTNLEFKELGSLESFL